MVIGPIEFAEPWWLVLLPVCWALVFVIGRKSLAEWRAASRITALAVRLLVVLLIVGALADPYRRDEAEAVAVTVIRDASRSVPATAQLDIARYVEAARESGMRENDLIGSVLVGTDGYVQSTPSPRNSGLEERRAVDPNGTNLAAGVKLAQAAAPKDAANRFLLISDGNETEGSLLAAAEAALAAGVQIDVLPIKFDYDEEVMLERLVAPATARLGETVSLAVVMRAESPATGRLIITENGTPIDLDPAGDEVGQFVQLAQGKQVVTVQIEPTRDGPQTYEAIFEPISNADGTSTGDRVSENNRQLAVTFVNAEGKVAVVSSVAEESAPLVSALLRAGLPVEEIYPDELPASLTELTRYDAVVLVNQPAYNFSELQADLLRQYVHDSGGGLVMTGGPEGFGAGGWIGSPLEDALPVRLDPPSERRMPRGALVCVLHSIEMPNGPFWGKEVARKAAERLQPLDLIGLVEFTNFGGVDWVYRLQERGDGVEINRSIDNLTFGDMQDFDPSLELALAGLVAADAGQKHVIVISDGDPTISRGVLQKYQNAGISMSTISVFPHTPADHRRMEQMAEATGGNFYPIDTQAALVELPDIVIKEASTVKRALIRETDPFQPAVLSMASGPMAGVSSVPPISGYVVTTDRGGLSLVTMRGLDDDPIAAQWQHGLGRVVAFTSDVTTRWAAAWVAWEGFDQFWEQHIRWAMRPSGSANARLNTENRGGQTVVSIDLFDAQGDPLNFAQFRARSSTPDGEGADVSVRQIGPGRYEAVVPTERAGTYLVGLRYAAQDASGQVVEGTTQAAITRPFADEFKDLRDNSALLQQVAERTGGRVLSNDPAAADVWRREGLLMPVATRSIWLAVALSAIGLFLLDVAVRRVRIDPASIAAVVRRGFGKQEAADASSRLGGLQEARRKARTSLDERSKAVASRKFEADPAAGERAGPVALSGEAMQSDPSLSKPRPAEQAKKASEEDGGMSRLMQAKRRAQSEFDADKDENKG